MEEGIFTLWSIVHIFSGVVLGFLFSLKEIRLIEFAGFLAIIPLLLVNSPTVKLISLAVIFISILAFVVNRISKKKTIFHLSIDIVLTLFLLILWEIAEYLTYPITHFGTESTLNKTSDVIFGFLGFLITYLVIHWKFINKNKKHRKKSQ